MKRQVSFHSFDLEPEVLQEAELLAISKVLRSGNWILGNNVIEFERVWAQQCGTTNAVGVANGLDAIEICLRALDIGPGHEVITTPVTAFATTLAIQRSGAIPVFADINPITACLDPVAVERCLTPNTRAVLAVHLYGRAADMDNLVELCRINGLHLIEDCAQAHSCQYGNKPVGSLGICAAWSFYPTKNLGAIGDAGAITSSDSTVVARAKQLRNYGQRDRYHHDLPGLNSRLDEIQAALLLTRLPYLKTWTDRRRDIASTYFKDIKHPALELPSNPADRLSNVNHLFVVRTLHRAAAVDQLSAMGIQTLIHYPVPCHQQKALGEHRLDPAGLTNAENHCRSCLSLPLHPLMGEEEITWVVEACNSLILT